MTGEYHILFIMQYFVMVFHKKNKKTIRKIKTKKRFKIIYIYYIYIGNKYKTRMRILYVND